jgi:CRISPR-associated endonuclease/helicase Cas3
VDQPSVIVATPDLAGSALLFRHYLATASAWPILAGLVGVDVCWVVDESHLQDPFVATLRRCGISGPGQLGLPSWLIETTATPPHNHADVLELTARDRKHPVAAKRLAVTRQLRLHSNVKESEVPAELARLAIEAGRAGRRAILVVANTVRDARRTVAKIEAQDKQATAHGRVLLIHGQQRETERALGMQQARGAFGMNNPSPDDGASCWYLVTTPAIEVGADLSADHLVTVSCPGDSLIQRLGRLGRRADRARYICDVVPLEQSKKQSAGWQAAYRARADECASFLHHLAVSAGGEHRAGSAIVELRTGSKRQQLLSGIQAPHAEPAPLWASGMLALIQTRPAPLNSPDLDALIHGLDEADRTAYLAWRADLSADGEQSWAELVDSWPVRPHEVIEVPVRDMGKDGWLNGRRYVRIRPSGTPHITREPPAAGDTVVVPASYGGHDGQGFNPDSYAQTEDVADAVPNHPKGPRLRLDPELLDAHTELIGQCVGVLTDQAAGETDCLQAVQDLLTTIANQRNGTVGHAARALSAGGLGLDWELRRRGLAVSARARTADDDDELSLTRPVPLEVHQADVAERAVAMARRCGVPDDLAEAVRLGALHHDDGKLAEPFQRVLGDGQLPRSPLAKSGLPRRRWRLAARAAGLPPGFRHEALSAALAEPLGDLPAHLAGASHGYGRPCFPASVTPQSLRTEASINGQIISVEGSPLQRHGFDRLMNRFLRLNRDYGPWGLAWLEAAVRLADQAASAEPRHLAPPAPTITAAPIPAAAGLRHTANDRLAAIVLSTIPHRTVAGWLSTLGLFGCYIGLANDPDLVRLSWLDTPTGPVPCLEGPLTQDDLFAALAQQAKALTEPWKHPIWTKLHVEPGKAASAAADQPLLGHQPCAAQHLPSLFCILHRPVSGRHNTVASISLNELLVGLSGHMSLAKLAPALAASVTPAELAATFTGRWQPRHGQKSLGLDWATVADGADQAGQALGLACRDWFALLGATWHGPIMLPGRRLVWPVWQRPLDWQAVLHLTARPELATAISDDQRPAQRARRQLRQWTVTRLLVAQTVRRTMHTSSHYEVWTDADEIDMRALR